MEQHILQTDKGRVFYWQSDHWDVNKDTLQHDGEKYFRYKIRNENDMIKKENDKILNDAEKDLQKAAVRKP